MLDTGNPPLTDNALSLFRQGLALAATKEHRKAIEMYSQVLRLKPDCAEVWYEFGLALENLGAYQEAIARYDRALTLKPSSELACEIWHSRGNALQYGLGDYEAAIRSYDRALQIRPGAVEIWQNRGNVLLYGLNRYEEAIVNYERVLFIDPYYYLAWRNRGNALTELKRYEEAIASYDQALLIEPGDQISSYARSCAVNQAGLEEKLPTTNPVWYGRGYSDINQVSDPVKLDSSEVEGLSEKGKSLSPETEIEQDTLTGSSSSDFSSTQYPTLIVEDSQGRRELLLRNASYTIGRDPKTDICLYSHYASRNHAVLTRMAAEDDTFYYLISDGDVNGKRSTNGLIINGRKQQIWNLVHEDTVVFGPDVRITYLTPRRRES